MDGVKCKYEPCSCFVGLGEIYCHDSCREESHREADAGIFGKCRCRHVDCGSR